jgi:hypothetical protein
MLLAATGMTITVLISTMFNAAFNVINLIK